MSLGPLPHGESAESPPPSLGLGAELALEGTSGAGSGVTHPSSVTRSWGPPCGGWGPTIEGDLEELLVFENFLEEHHGKLVVVGGRHSHTVALHSRVSCGEDSERSALAGRTELLLSPQPSAAQHLCGGTGGSVYLLGGSRPREPQSQGPGHSAQGSPLMLSRLNWPGWKLGTKVLVK